MDKKLLPLHPDPDQYKKQAKDLVKQHKARHPEAIGRLKLHPRFSKLSDSELRSTKFLLADAQLIIAREHGFGSWAEFKKRIDAINSANTPTAIWEAAKLALIAGDELELARLMNENQQIFRDEMPPSYGSGGLSPNYRGDDVRSIIVREHHFDNWTEFEEYKRALTQSDSSVSKFEAAVEAIVSGDAYTLERLLKKYPELIRARSTRKHHSTLLHYIGANGIEDFRQRTPPNAVNIALMLLEAGAEVEATAGMYGGGSTTLGLVATSIHPLEAGVQDALIETLIEHGAKVADVSLVNGALANGRKAAAEFLAGHGAPLDLEGAAGVGRLDLVRSFFNADGSLKPGAAQEQMKDGFTWACEFGRTEVVAFLLDAGVDVNAKLKHDGQTGLHWAALGGHVETVELLLERNAPVDARDESWGSTPLGWALYGWSESASAIGAEPYYRIVELLIAAGSALMPEWLADETIRADSRMLRALSATHRL
ncbi:MAG: hypothetical protein DMF61_11680 [Blastocatellia bacterium AA13]|nr:MAG: hypothetical protein DMF61_11680 [Blastocatellia bacterium AA13]